MTFHGIDPDGATGLQRALSGQADGFDGNAAEMSTLLSALALSAAVPDLLTSAADDDRLGAQLLHGARSAAERYVVGAAGLPAHVVGHLVALQAGLMAALGARGRALAGVASGALPGQVVIEGTGEADTITVRMDGDELVVDVDGTETRYSAAETAEVVIRAGGGNDTITVDGDVTVSFTIMGSYGDDDIVSGGGDDVVIAGDGMDYVDGGAGDDHLHGNQGDDTIYGLDGDDYLFGGEGADYLEGARGDDRVYGDAGHDVVSGGHGDDQLHGGADADLLYSGTGANEVVGGAGADTAYHTASDHVQDDTVTAVLIEIDPTMGSTITVEGSDEFVARVEADLAMLASSPTGQQMLVALDDAAIASQQDGGIFNSGANDGNLVTIVEAEGYESEAHGESGPDATEDEDGPDSGTDVEIRYAVRYAVLVRPQGGPDSWMPPIGSLYHEMAHAFSLTTGNGEEGDYAGPGIDGQIPTSDIERQAVGLPVDHDGDPTTPEVPAPQQPEALTENALRTELGIPLRTSYQHRPEVENPEYVPPALPSTAPS